MTRIKISSDDPITDSVWCTVCEARHLSTVPVVTYACADCPWAQWYPSEATRHALENPEHCVYPIIHLCTQDQPAEYTDYGVDITKAPGWNA